jgi:hypothetical protein
LSPPCSVHPLAFIARGCRRFHLLLQGQSNGRHASWWREISAVRHSPLIEAKQINAFAAATSLGQLHVTSSKEDSEQCSVKRHRLEL